MAHYTRRSNLLLTVAACLAACVVFGQTAPSVGDEPATPVAAKADANVPAGQRLFYASHSLMWDVPDPLTEEVKAAGITGHEIVGVQRNGFSTTLQMWNQGAQPKAALEAGKVDIFITSPMEMPDAGVDNFV